MPGFGPQMIGATEKALNALLQRVLAGSGLTEPEWVTLRLAAQHDDARPLAQTVRARAHLADADALVAALRDRGLLAGDALTPSGRALTGELQSRIAALTAPVWAGLSPADVAATERVLSTVTTEVERVLDALAQP